MNRRRLRSLVSILILAVWMPAQSPWVMSVAASLHHVHRTSLEWSENHLHVILHHDVVSTPVSSRNSEAAVRFIPQENTFAREPFPARQFVDVEHAAHAEDHLLHPFAVDEALAGPTIRLSFQDIPLAAFPLWVSASRPSIGYNGRRASPNLASIPPLRTTVLLI